MFPVSGMAGRSCLTQEQYPCDKYEATSPKQRLRDMYIPTMYFAGSALLLVDKVTAVTFQASSKFFLTKIHQTLYVYTDNIEHVLLPLYIAWLVHHTTDSTN